MADILVREMNQADRTEWARMRFALWPEEDYDALAQGIDELLATNGAWAFAAVARDGKICGFAEVVVRPCANGCDSRPVAFLEGIWVDESFRRRGVGILLISHVEAELTARGFHELGSDAPIANLLSHAAHRAWGFSETERVVYFRKSFSATRRSV